MANLLLIESLGKVKKLGQILGQAGFDDPAWATYANWQTMASYRLSLSAP
jgi:hypothetical protein